MSDSQDTVFISYRRSTSKNLARTIFEHLRGHGYDVFLDVETIDSGAFDTIILRQIAARAHFVLLLSPGALERCQNEDDWLRREIEEAMRSQRNIVPIIEEGFDFDEEIQFLPPEWRDQFVRHNMLPYSHYYYDSAMEKLRTRFLKFPEYIEIKPAPKSDQIEVQRRIAQAVKEIDQPPAVVESDTDKLIGQFFIAYNEEQWENAQDVLGQLSSRADLPSFFDTFRYTQEIDDTLQRIEEERIARELEAEQRRAAERQYNIVRMMAQHDVPERVLDALNVFWENYPDYDPDNIAEACRLQIEENRRQAMEREYADLWKMAEEDEPEQVLEALDVFWLYYPDYDPDNLAEACRLQIKENRRQAMEREYDKLRKMAQYDLSERVWSALQSFWITYPDYDPDKLADKFRPKTDSSNTVLQSRLKTPEKKTPPKPKSSTPTRRESSPAAAPPTASKPKIIASTNDLPAPFGWIKIPQRIVKGGIFRQETTVPGFSIAKYPVTNAQFVTFVEAGGYQQKKWWVDAGWKYLQEKKLVAPSHLAFTALAPADHPVVTISWYEALAFCSWLSDVTHEKIMLPTADQWQYAAQGDGDRRYPWGDQWDGQRCNNSVKPYKGNGTSPVTKYEGKGNSFFGVVDMAGNVWEWTLTDFYGGKNDIHSPAQYRVLCGTSWHADFLVDNFRCTMRGKAAPNTGYGDVGFRIIRS